MKIRIFIAIAFGVLALLAFTAQAEQLSNATNNTATLVWDWPTNAFAIANAQMKTAITNPIAWPALTSFVYRVYSSPILQGTNTPWTLALTLRDPPAVTNSDGSVWIWAAVPTVGWAQTFYTVSVSNSVGASFFSGLAATAPPPQSQGNFLIQSTH